MAFKKKKKIKLKKKSKSKNRFAFFVTFWKILTKIIIEEIVGGEFLNEATIVLVGILIPFIGTSLGAGMVLFMKNNISDRINKIFLGLASGIMVAASVWSLIIPSIEMAEHQGIIEWLPAGIGIALGAVFIPILDKFLNFEKINLKTNKKNILLALSITLHNIPEGMAVGIIFANALSGNFENLIMSAFTLSIGIAIQNFPEGAAISLPLKSDNSKFKAFIMGVSSGIVEPIAAIITIVMASIINPLLPFLLAFAAGAMIYVVFEELLPEANQNGISKIGTYSAVLGFIIMMVLDVMLG